MVIKILMGAAKTLYTEDWGVEGWSGHCNQYVPLIIYLTVKGLQCHSAGLLWGFNERNGRHVKYMEKIFIINGNIVVNKYLMN